MPKAPSNGIEIDYEVIGEGEPLVLVMGFSAQRILWPDELVRLLNGAGFKVVRFDNRDVGGSTKLDHLGVPNVQRALLRSLVGIRDRGPYSMLDMAKDVVGLLDHLGIDRAHVVGASMGGMIAQELALSFPERLRTLTSIMSSPGGRRYSVGHPKALGALLAKPPRTREESADRMVATFRVLTGTGFPFDEARIRALAHEAWDRGAHPPGAARQFAAILGHDSDRRDRLRNVRTPTLVLHGTDDPLIPERAGRATARLIPGARYVPIPGMGHDFPAEAMPLIAGAVHAHVLSSRGRG